MISGVPNFTMVIGYTNASWTLKADLVNRYVCRLLNHLDAAGLRVGHAGRAARGRPTSRSSTSRRATCSAASTTCPSRASRTPWRLHQNYIRDVQLMRRGPLDDEGMTFQRRPPPATEQAVA